MRDWDLEIYTTLLKRPGLCMGTNDWNEVEQFIRAYELGSKWECDFMSLLTKQLHDKYGIAMPTNGLIAQLKLVANQLNQNWEELFIEETKEVLINESDKDHQYRFQALLRKKLADYFQEIPKQIDATYFMNLNLIDRQIDDWHGENLSLEEIKLFKAIRETLSNEISIHLTEKFALSEALRLKIVELKAILKKKALAKINQNK